MVALQMKLSPNNTNPFKLKKPNAPVRGILSCRAAVTNIWVSPGPGKTSRFVKEDKERRRELLPIRRLGRQLKRRRIGEGTQRGRQIVGKREREIERGEEELGNPLKYILKPLCRAQPGIQRIHRPAPERRLCNQSLPSSIRQLPALTGGQLRREDRVCERESESEVGENRMRAKALAMTSCWGHVLAGRQEGDHGLWTKGTGGWLDGPKWRYNYGINENQWGSELIFGNAIKCLMRADGKSGGSRHLSWMTGNVGHADATGPARLQWRPSNKL